MAKSIIYNDEARRALERRDGARDAPLAPRRAAAETGAAAAGVDGIRRGLFAKTPGVKGRSGQDEQEASHGGFLPVTSHRRRRP